MYLSFKQRIVIILKKHTRLDEVLFTGGLCGAIMLIQPLEFLPLEMCECSHRESLFLLISLDFSFFCFLLGLVNLP